MVFEKNELSMESVVWCDSKNMTSVRFTSGKQALKTEMSTAPMAGCPFENK
jgi:hypothetical protein